MMKKIIAVLFLVAFAFSANAQVVSTDQVPPKTSAGAEEVLGMQETTFDFGKIPQGKPVTHIFDVVNNGKDSLKISNIQASCGCTTPEWEREKVQAAGGKTRITVGYNAAAEGPFSKFITITYNGTQTKQITIKGEVWKTPVASAPENKELKSLKED
jgi:Protein of unknown function (DUF1573)